MGHDSFEDAINNLANEVQEAQIAISINGTDILKEVFYRVWFSVFSFGIQDVWFWQTAAYFIQVTTDLIKDFVDRVTDHVENQIGRCGPLSLSVNATVTATCDKILLPWVSPNLSIVSKK